ncbi:MAG: inositol monophosphatase [Gemmatimonadetes bacterium]|nr:inositol monophosphatase [Gemmatimonadota bacterium]
MGANLAELLRTSLAAVEAAGAVHRRWLGRVEASSWELKGHSDFVSDVDREAQDAVLAVLRARHPGHKVLAEETEQEALSHTVTGPVWVVDPLDGTTNFLHGHPHYSASVAVCLDGVPVAGAVLSAATGERWWAARGLGAYKNGLRIRVSGIHELHQALIGTGFPFKHLHRLPEYLTQFDRVLRSTAGIRRCGSAALDLCYVASGLLDGFWELWLEPWDVAAGWIMVQEAGGVISRLDGSVPDLKGGAVLAGNIYLWDKLHRLLSGNASST